MIALFTVTRKYKLDLFIMRNEFQTNPIITSI